MHGTTGLVLNQANGSSNSRAKGVIKLVVSGIKVFGSEHVETSWNFHGS